MRTFRGPDRVKHQMSSLSDHERFERDHRWAPDQMSALIDGDLGTDARERLMRHLRECDECRRLLAGLRETVAALVGMGRPTAEIEAVQIAAAVRARLGDPSAS